MSSVVVTGMPICIPISWAIDQSAMELEWPNRFFKAASRLADEYLLSSNTDNAVFQKVCTAGIHPRGRFEARRGLNACVAIALDMFRQS